MEIVEKRLAQFGAFSRRRPLLRFSKQYLPMSSSPSYGSAARSHLSGLRPHQHNGLRQAIKDFLFAASSMPPPGGICPRCRQDIRHITATFQFYGEEGTYRVPLPVCRCEIQDPKI